MPDLEIYKLKKDYNIPEKELGKILKKAERLLKLRNFKISLAIVDDKTIQELNRKYRFRNKVTDVLSFEMSPLILPADFLGTDPEAELAPFVRNGAGNTDDKRGSSATCCAPKCNAGACPPQKGGEIVISYPEAKRQVGEYKETLQEVILRLFVHGLLHLSGFKHNTIKKRLKMEDVQNKLLHC